MNLVVIVFSEFMKKTLDFFLLLLYTNKADVNKGNHKLSTES